MVENDRRRQTHQPKHLSALQWTILFVLGSLSLLAVSRLLPSWVHLINHETDETWNVLYHLGGNSPWIRKVDDIITDNVAPPTGCRVEQAHLLSRHAERYPTVNAGNRILTLTNRIKNAKLIWKDDLSFLNNWTCFSQDTSIETELTYTSANAGTLSGFRTGTILRTRYQHLLPPKPTTHKLNLWASDSSRVIETAEYFAHGFWGLNWTDQALLHIIPETVSQGANTLTPGDACLQYQVDPISGRGTGYQKLDEFRGTYLGAVAVRLNKQNKGIVFDESEVYSMQELCGFETLVMGTSPWCNVFTEREWLDFEYARDVLHWYRTGPGNHYSAAMGALWLNATANILIGGPNLGKLFFSFVHDGDILPVLTALNLFPPAIQPSLPTSHRLKARAFQSSQLVPMAGRLILELLSCSQAKSSNDMFVRLNINDGIVAIPNNCTEGPGLSCPLGKFMRHIQDRVDAAGDFRKICGLGEDVPDHITFLHQ